MTKLSKKELDVIYNALSRYDWDAPQEEKEILESAMKKIAQRCVKADRRKK